MKKLLFLLLFLCVPWPAYAQFSQLETNYLKTIISQWIAAGSTIGGSAGHTIQEDGTPLTARSTLNFTGTGITCSDSGGVTVCDVPAGTVDVSADYSWTGTQSFLRNKFEIKDNTDPTKIITFNNSANATKTARDYTLPDASTTFAGLDITNAWTGANTWPTNRWSLLDSADNTKVLTFNISGFTSKTGRDISLPNASTRLIGDSDFAATGVMARTAANTYAGRTLGITAGSTNYLAWTNGNGVSGNPTIGLGANVVATDRANTYTTGAQNFSAASSFYFPTASDAAPTTSATCAYDSNANRLKCGFNGSTVTLATLSEVQPLNAKLTAFSGLTGVNHALAIFTGASTMTTATLPACLDAGGSHLNYDTATRTFSCGTSSTGGLSGLVTGSFLLATGATAAGTSSNLTESGGVVNAANGLTVGNVAANKLAFDTSAVTGTKTWTVMNFDGTVRVSTGAFTAGNMVSTDANGLLVDGGAAGTGTWTDSSKNTGTNKELVATEAGGTNTITTGINAYFDAGSLTPDGTQCAEPAKTTIGTGPTGYVIVCADNAGSIFDGQIALSHAVATITFTLTVNDVDSSAQHFAGGFKAMCRNNGTAVDNTWGSAQTVEVTMTTANTNYTGTTAAVTPNGTCSAGATLFFRFTMDAGTNTDDGNARVLGVLLKQAS